ncbi:hypothetical protein OPB01_002537 [Salmonella enterica]|nr:hypothetical protein [Salmonella enterica]
MVKIGFKQAKNQILKVLDDGTYQHETRDDYIEKNKFQNGDISKEEVKRIIISCCGDDYESQPHHQAKHIEVHIIKKSSWYIKFYFLDEDGAMFISVHQ